MCDVKSFRTTELFHFCRDNNLHIESHHFSFNVVVYGPWKQKKKKLCAITTRNHASTDRQLAVAQCSEYDGKIGAIREKEEFRCCHFSASP